MFGENTPFRPSVEACSRSLQAVAPRRVTGAKLRNRVSLQQGLVLSLDPVTGSKKGEACQPKQKPQGLRIDGCPSATETRPGSGAFCGFPRDKKRLGARGSAWPCVSETAAAARHGSRLVSLREGWFRLGPVRACLSILELCERFRDSSQASGASQRVQRASDALPLIGRCGGWPCTPWPSRGRSRIVALLRGRLSLA